MTFFDSNCGLGNFSKPVLYTDPDGLLRLMEKSAIAKSLVYHSLSREISPVEGNRMLLDRIRGCDSLYPSWIILPEESGDIADTEDYMKRGIESGVSAFRIYPNTYRIPLGHYVNTGTFSFPEKKRIPIIIDPGTGLTWNTDAGDWENIRLLCERHPALPVIFSEFRTRYQIRIVTYFLKKYRNFFFDIGSCWNYKVVEKLSEMTDGANLVTGTNLPFAEPGQSIGMILMADVEQEIKDRIAHLNLKNLIDKIKR